MIIPTEFHDLEELGCDMECSGYSHLYMHTSWPWFKHVLPQLADRRYVWNQIIFDELFDIIVLISGWTI